MQGHEAQRVVTGLSALLPHSAKYFREWLPPNGASHGFVLDHLLILNFLWICIFFLLAHLFLLYPLLQRKHAAQPQRKLMAAELLLLAGVVAVFVWMTISSQRLWANHRYTGASPEAMQVEVVGTQFQWYFRYPGDDATFGKVKPSLVDPAGGNPLGIDPSDPAGKDDVVASELVLPVDREADLRIRSHDVMHGFFVPGMRLKQDAVPGMVLHIHFTPARLGQYPILCSQLCGLGHARMHAWLHVIPQDQFVKWLNRREQVRMAEEAAR